MTIKFERENYKIFLSDSSFKPERKKPTISVYDEKSHIEKIVASFNSNESFEWFMKEVLGVE